MIAPGNTRPLRVCIDARLPDGVAGGVQQTVLGLAEALARLDGDEEYLFLCTRGEAGWLEPRLGGRCRPLHVEPPPRDDARWKAAVRAVLPAPWIERGARAVTAARRELQVPEVPSSDGTIERAGADVMHFTIQSGFRTRVPSIYVPHDLQHVHLPGLFSRWEWRWRELTYRALSAQAQAVVALSTWGREDLVRSHGVPREKIPIINWAPALAAYEPPTAGQLLEARRRLGLPEAFALFPAQTFRHKNHLALLEAVAIARDRHGVRLQVVCSGRRNEFFPRIERRLRRLGLEDQVRFVGYLGERDVVALYRMARFVIFPSLFEGFGMPVAEAFWAGVPVASSTATCLPEIVGDAGLLFDPQSPAEIAAAAVRLWSDGALRDDLAARGARRAALYTWDRVARSYRALYRRVAERSLTGEDAALLAAAYGVSAGAPDGSSVVSVS